VGAPDPETAHRLVQDVHPEQANSRRRTSSYARAPSTYGHAVGALFDSVR
jgi:hypothetical protein